MISAIIVAAGKGTRMGANVDKLWLEVAGRPVIAHTWKKWNDAAGVDEIILVVRDGMQPHFAELAQQYQFQNLIASFRAAQNGRIPSGTASPRFRRPPKSSPFRMLPGPAPARS